MDKNTTKRKSQIEVAFFMRNFLEPTHHSIVQVLSSLNEYCFNVFSNRFLDQEYFRIPNIKRRNLCIKVENPMLYNSKFIHALYDGKTALKAGQLAKEVRLPFLLSFHGGFDTNAKIFDSQYKEETKVLAQQASAVTVTNQLDVERLESIGVKRNIHIIPVPVDSDILPTNILNR